MKPEPSDERTRVIREMLQAMPIDKRAEAIVEIFSVAAAEFAAMVLEHVKPDKKTAKRRAARSSVRAVMVIRRTRKKSR